MLVMSIVRNQNGLQIFTIIHKEIPRNEDYQNLFDQLTTSHPSTNQTHIVRPIFQEFVTLLGLYCIMHAQCCKKSWLILPLTGLFKGPIFQPPEPQFFPNREK